MVFEVLSPGFLTTIQDGGRVGLAHLGVPRDGAMDWYALHAANMLVHNTPDLAGLEYFGEGPVLMAGADCLVAGSGRGFELEAGGRMYPLWMSVLVRRGEIINLKPAAGCRTGWGYLAVSGGIDTPPVLGSRATDLRGGFGGLDGRPLQEGDHLPVGAFSDRIREWAGSRLSASSIPTYGGKIILSALSGPQEEEFSRSAQQLFWSSLFHLSTDSDRMGYRLEGPGIEKKEQREMLSEGVVEGAVQVLPSGQVVVLMAGAQTTGGYPKIAVVSRASQPLLAQALPGDESLQFEKVMPETALAELRRMKSSLSKVIRQLDDDNEIL